MAKLLAIYAHLIFAFALTTCYATTYIVGDTSGWDISSDLDAWAASKRFTVGDSLVFQYSSGSAVYELTRDDFEKCNTRNPKTTYSNGNTTVTLTRPGEWYFSDANRLYCLGGLKLQVNVEDDKAVSPAAAPAVAPAAAPQEPPGGSNLPPGRNSLPRPSSKNNNNPSSVDPISAGFALHDKRNSAALMAFLIGFSVATMSILSQI